ncbi:hypothetical protein BASA83_009072 [Batrachochytrium salamandrivorans]|nr:hypothetical protein BASA83_009072 [Batrachochytrium salamandrivorans]
MRGTEESRSGTPDTGASSSNNLLPKAAVSSVSTIITSHFPAIELSRQPIPSANVLTVDASHGVGATAGCDAMQQPLLSLGLHNSKVAVRTTSTPVKASTWNSQLIEPDSDISEEMAILDTEAVSAPSLSSISNVRSISAYDTLPPIKAKPSLERNSASLLSGYYQDSIRSSSEREKKPILPKQASLMEANPFHAGFTVSDIAVPISGLALESGVSTEAVSAATKAHQLQQSQLWKLQQIYRSKAKPIEQHQITIHIDTLTGKIIPLTIYPTQTVADIKYMVLEAEGIPVNSQHLVYCERHLVNDLAPMGEVGVQDGSTLQLVLRMVGGLGPPTVSRPAPATQDSTVFLLCKQNDDVFMLEVHMKDGKCPQTAAKHALRLAEGLSGTKVLECFDSSEYFDISNLENLDLELDAADTDDLELQVEAGDGGIKYANEEMGSDRSSHLQKIIKARPCSSGSNVSSSTVPSFISGDYADTECHSVSWCHEDISDSIEQQESFADISSQRDESSHSETDMENMYRNNRFYSASSQRSSPTASLLGSSISSTEHYIKEDESDYLSTLKELLYNADAVFSSSGRNSSTQLFVRTPRMTSSKSRRKKCALLPMANRPATAISIMRLPVGARPMFVIPKTRPASAEQQLQYICQHIQLQLSRQPRTDFQFGRDYAIKDRQTEHRPESSEIDSNNLTESVRSLNILENASQAIPNTKSFNLTDMNSLLTQDQSTTSSLVVSKASAHNLHSIPRKKRVLSTVGTLFSDLGHISCEPSRPNTSSSHSHISAAAALRLAKDLNSHTYSQMNVNTNEHVKSCMGSLSSLKTSSVKLERDRQRLDRNLLNTCALSRNRDEFHLGKKTTGSTRQASLNDTRLEEIQHRNSEVDVCVLNCQPVFEPDLRLPVMNESSCHESSTKVLEFRSCHDIASRQLTCFQNPPQKNSHEYGYNTLCSLESPLSSLTKQSWDTTTDPYLMEKALKSRNGGSRQLSRRPTPDRASTLGSRRSLRSIRKPMSPELKAGIAASSTTVSDRTTKPKCTTCNKKLGAASHFKCKCGSTFCSIHRYSDRHPCSFDYKEAGKASLIRNNPSIKNDKLVRL